MADGVTKSESPPKRRGYSNMLLEKGEAAMMLTTASHVNRYVALTKRILEFPSERFSFAVS